MLTMKNEAAKDNVNHPGHYETGRFECKARWYIDKLIELEDGGDTNASV